MTRRAEQASHLDRLNPAQRRAVTHGLDGDPRQPPPLLIIAGAGSGKTLTLAHRVAELVIRGVNPQRILLLTFSRRAAQEMKRRAERIVSVAVQGRYSANSAGSGALRWAGTFHAVANRLLRRFASAVGLAESFTVLDRSDSADLMNLLRSDLALAGKGRRFPQKGTCLTIYSRVVNSELALDECLQRHFPWCAEWTDALRRLFRAYVEAKQDRAVLDYDDLLLYWHHLMLEPELATEVAELFDHVLVDEYQDTNLVQARILLALRPAGRGVTVVGDDAQAIYGFRAATVRNILDFPRQFEPAAEVVTLEQNYRSTQPILAAANAVIAAAGERYTKELFSYKESEQKPRLVAVEGESEQALYVVECVLQGREAGVPLQRQAVLFRTAHHSDLLEIELGRRNIPFVKYGGLKFLEAGHVKDLLAILRWAENVRDTLAAFRTLQLLPGIGPANARRAIEYLEAAGGRFEALAEVTVPAAARAEWSTLAKLMLEIGGRRAPWPGSIHRTRLWYEPYLEPLYDMATVRAADLEQLEQIAGRYPSRERFLTELTLDPPEATGDEAGPPHLDEDFLILSTIHSAKGQEWDSVYVLNVVDGCIPSDMATRNAEEIEEERRLLYVAMTRAERELHLIHPLRFYVTHQRRSGDRHLYAPISRFLPAAIRDRFESLSAGPQHPADELRTAHGARIDIGARLREMW